MPSIVLLEIFYALFICVLILSVLMKTLAALWRNSTKIRIFLLLIIVILIAINLINMMYDDLTSISLLLFWYYSL